MSAGQGGSGGHGGRGEVEADCEGGWCTIAAGMFLMGSPESEFGHPAVAEDQVEVTLTRSFLIQQHETTQAEWLAHGLPNPSRVREDGTGDCSAPECPVGNVTWFEVAAFANTLSSSEGLRPCFELHDCTGELGEGLVCGAASLAAATVYECEGYRMPTEAGGSTPSAPVPARPSILVKSRHFPTPQCVPLTKI